MLQLNLSALTADEVLQITSFISSSTEIEYSISDSKELSLEGGDPTDYLQLGNYLGINELQEPIVEIPLKQKK